MARLVIGTSKTPATAAIVKQVSAPTGKYQLLDRVVDDNNTDIGCVVGFHYDENDTEYAVVCLNAVYNYGVESDYMTNPTEVTGLGIDYFGTAIAIKETATSRTNKIINQCTVSGTTSGIITKCRALEFTIGGVVYAGQLPNMMEVLYCVQNWSYLNDNDPTATSYPDGTVMPNGTYITNHQGSATKYIAYNENGSKQYNKNYYYRTLPILEIPNAI